MADGGESGVSAIGEREIVRPHCFLGSQSPRDQPQKPSRACGRAAAAPAHGVISTPTAASRHIVSADSAGRVFTDAQLAIKQVSPA